ncbi:MAG: cyclic nucleotide-binding domain-containing protein [Bacillota bacterium]
MKYVIFHPVRLKEYEMEIIGDAGVKCQYKKGQLIFKAADDASKLFLVETGLVRVCRLLEDSGHKVVSVRGKGELIGLEDVFCGLKMTCTARAISDVTVIAVKREDFLEILDCDPFLLNRIIHILPLQVGSFRTRKGGRVFNCR